MADLNFWVVAVPAKPTQDITFQSIQRAATNLASVSRFPIHAKLSVGTLDLLMSMSDELVKLDHIIEHTTRKLGNQIWTFLDRKPAKGEVFLNIKATTIVDYVKNFEWDTAKYPVRLSVKALAEKFQQQVVAIEEDFRQRMAEYSNLAHSVAQYERSLSANLQVRDLTDIIDIDDVYESDYLTTLFVVVTKNQEKEWEEIYDTFDNAVEDPAQGHGAASHQASAHPPGERPTILKFVVPGSSKRVYQEGDQSLMSVTLLKRFKPDFLRAAQRHKFTVREVKIDRENPISAKENHKKMKEDLAQQQNKLLLWCKTNFSETFTAWIHLKALRVHVETILRFGLPPKNVAAILQLDRPANEKKLRLNLSNEFAEYSSEYIQDGKDDISNYTGNEKFYPYVFLEMNLNYARE